MGAHAPVCARSVLECEYVALSLCCILPSCKSQPDVEIALLVLRCLWDLPFLATEILIAEPARQRTTNSTRACRDVPHSLSYCLCGAVLYHPKPSVLGPSVGFSR